MLLKPLKVKRQIHIGCLKRGPVAWNELQFFTSCLLVHCYSLIAHCRALGVWTCQQQRVSEWSAEVFNWLNKINLQYQSKANLFNLLKCCILDVVLIMWPFKLYLASDPKLLLKINLSYFTHSYFVSHHQPCSAQLWPLGLFRLHWIFQPPQCPG